MEATYSTAFTFSDALLFIFVLAVCIHLHYILRYYRPLAFYQKQKKTSSNIFGVSVIVAAKNEFKNLKENLPFLLEQEGVEFELLIVDDHSTDGSIRFLKEVDNSRLKVIQSNDAEHGKKRALAKGVQQAQYDYLVFTDADCKPSSKQWLMQMTELLNENQIVLGHGRFYKEEGFLNRLIRFECFLNAMQYMAFALGGKPYMGVGRNLAIHKKVFQSSELNMLSKIKSGDDDLLVNEMGKYYQTGIVLNKEAHTISRAENNWKSYFFQKRRQVQAGNFYKLSDKIRLSLLWASQFYSWWIFIILMILGDYQILILVLFLAKQIIQALQSRQIAKRLSDQDLWPYWPILEFVLLHWLAYVVVSTWVKKVDRWK